MKTIIHTEQAPAAIGPYSQGVRSGKWLFTAGQVGFDPASGEFVEGGVEAQTRQVMQNLAAILAAAGGGLEHVVKTTVFLVDMGDFAAMNAVYAEAFGEHRPARSTVAVAALPRGARVEIEAIAALPTAAEQEEADKQARKAAKLEKKLAKQARKEQEKAEKEVEKALKALQKAEKAALEEAQKAEAKAAKKQKKEKKGGKKDKEEEQDELPEPADEPAAAAAPTTIVHTPADRKVETAEMVVSVDLPPGSTAGAA